MSKKHGAVAFLVLAVVACMLCGCSDSTDEGNLGPSVGPGSTAAGTSASAGTTASAITTTPSTASTTTTDDGVADLPMEGPTIIDVPQEEVAGVVISPEGGVIRYGPVKVEIPAGAVDSDTAISITRLEGPFHDGPGDSGGTDPIEAVPVSSIYDLGPAGTRFAKPVTVTLPFNPGVGPEEIAPEEIAVAYFNGEYWASAGGTVDMANRTVTVQLRAFEGSALRTIRWAALGLTKHSGPGGKLIIEAIKWKEGPEAVDEDPISLGTAKDWVKPEDPVVKSQAAKAVIQDPMTKQTKPLSDPDLGAWMESICKSGNDPALVYKEPDGTITSHVWEKTPGSNWQQPSTHFTTGTKTGGALHGDCTDLTNAAVSVFTAADFPAKGVMGYGGGGSDQNAVHAWGEVVIGGRIYRVDEGGSLLASDTVGGRSNANWHYGEYKPITDPGDPRSECMWDKDGQKPYAADWWIEAVLKGHWEGTMTITEVLVSGEDVKAGLEKQGCDLVSLEELKGKPLPMTMDITLGQAKEGTATWKIDASSLDKADGSTYEIDPTTSEFTLTGDRLIFRLGEGEGASMAGTIASKGADILISGELSRWFEGLSLNAVWTVKKK